MTMFIIGFFVGGLFGMTIAACIVAKQDTREKREEDEKWIKESSQSSRMQ